MTDVHDSAARSRNMAAIRSRNTKPEIAVRKLLHSQGFRFRLHMSSLPGSPDIVLPKYRVVVFVHGCFWHAHGCSMFRIPETRRDFWIEKIGANARRDRKMQDELLRLGWRIAIVWECSLKGRNKRTLEEVGNELSGWITHGSGSMIEVSSLTNGSAVTDGPI